MFLLRTVAGRSAGQEMLVRRFPLVIGRAAHTDFRLEGAGVWEEHCRLELPRGEGVWLTPVGHAIVRVNGKPVQGVGLRSGDVIECGDQKVRFWLGPLDQGSPRAREFLTWFGLGVLMAIELMLALRLPQ